MPHLTMRGRRVLAGLSALTFAYSMTSDLPFTAQATPPGPVTVALAANIRDARISYGRPVVVAGAISGAAAGQEVALQYRQAGSAWQTLRMARTGAGGRYRLAAALHRSGVVRVTVLQAAVRSAAPASGAPAPAASPERRVVVGALISAGQRSTDVLAGHRAQVSGTVRPWIAGRRVALQVRQHGRWITVARGGTGARGRYRLTYTPNRTGSQRIRVRFGGDAVNGPSVEQAGEVQSFRSVEASWYDVGGGAVACSGLSGVRMGVANKTLPCGTHLTLRYRGRSVGVTVIDRGPFVAGREFDLTAPVKQALGFGDLGQVWSTR